MFDLNTTNGYFVHLLCAGLTGAAPSPAPDGVDFAAVYTLARRHKVDDVVYAAVSRLEHKPDFFDKWYKRHCMAVARNATQLYEHGQICHALTQAGVKILPYKGIVLKELYPEASMRYMADIDLLYVAPDGDHGRVKAAMEALGYTTEQFGREIHDTYHKPPVMNVELHRIIFSQSGDGYLSTADYMNAATPDANGVMTLPLPYLYFASLTHMIKHLRTDVADVRGLIDLYLLRLAMSPKQQAQADGLVAQADLTRTDAILRAISRAWFDREQADTDTLACATYLLDAVNDRRHADAKYLNSYRKGGSVASGKLRYFRHLVLPGYTYMKDHYPILSKAPVLLPIWWPVRWVDVLLHQRKRAGQALHRFDGMDGQNAEREAQTLAMFGLK